MRLLLIRDYRNESCTLGKLWNPTSNMCVDTLELPWRNNQRRISCIPADTYICKRDRYNRGNYEAFELQNVTGRTEIKIHKGNYPSHVLGCIIVGSSRDCDIPAIWRSGAAFYQFMQDLKNVDTFKLDIVEHRLQ